MAFVAGQALISGHAPHAALGDPGVARAVAEGGLYLAALAVLSVAAGALLRRPAAAIAAMMAVVLVLPLIAQALPDSWRSPVTGFWPAQAGGQLTSVRHSARTLQPWPGSGVMCLFTAIVYAIAWTLLDRRDADGGQGASPYPVLRFSPGTWRKFADRVKCSSGFTRRHRLAEHGNPGVRVAGEPACRPGPVQASL